MTPRTPANSASSPASTKPEAWAATAWLKLGLRIIEPLSVAGLLVFLLGMSWLRWSDPLIDFPKNLYLAWRISEGDLLYRQVTNWYGPLAQLIQGAGFRLFGVGLDTMLWMNIALLVGVILLLREIFGILGNRLSGWLCSVVFVVVFALGQFTSVGNYNFVTPYVTQAAYTFAGLLVALWGVLRHRQSERRRWLAVAGAGLAIAYLDKPEGLLAAAGAVGLYLLVRTLERARQVAGRTDWRAAGRWALPALGWLAAGFFALWLPVWVYFWMKGGAAYALLATDYVPYTMLSGAFRRAVLNASFMREISGFDHPWINFATELQAGAWLLAGCGIMAGAARGAARAKFGSLRWWWWASVVGAAGVGGVALGQRMNYWAEVGGAFVFPVLLVTLGLAVRALRAAWRGRENFGHGLELAVVGVAASLMLGRMVLNGRITHYGFFMMPLAVLFWIHLMVVEAARFRTEGGRSGINGLLAGVFALVVLKGAYDLLQVDLTVYATKNFPVSSGRDRFYSFGPDRDPAGLKLNLMIAMFQEKTPKAKTLAAFPEGIAVNYHLRVPSPLAEPEFLPVDLDYVGVKHVVGELAAQPPEAVILFTRDMSEFGVQCFGENPAAGRDIVQWLTRHYMIVDAMGGPTTQSITGHAIDLLVPKTDGSAIGEAPPGKP